MWPLLQRLAVLAEFAVTAGQAQLYLLGRGIRRQGKCLQKTGGTNRDGIAAERQTARMHQERRSAEREFIALRLILEDGTSAVTRDLSPIGLYVLLPASHVLTQRVPFH